MLKTVNIKYSFTDRRLIKKDERYVLMPNQSISSHDDFNSILTTIENIEFTKYECEITKAIRQDIRFCSLVESYTFSSTDITVLSEQKKQQYEMATFDGTTARIVFFHDMMHVAPICQLIFKRDPGYSLYWAIRHHTNNGVWIPIISFESYVRSLSRFAFRYGICSTIAESDAKISHFLTNFIYPSLLKSTKQSAQITVAYKIAERASEDLSKTIQKIGLGDDVHTFVYDFAKQQLEEKMSEKRLFKI